MLKYRVLRAICRDRMMRGLDVAVIMMCVFAAGGFRGDRCTRTPSDSGAPTVSSSSSVRRVECPKIPLFEDILALAEAHNEEVRRCLMKIYASRDADIEGDKLVEKLLAEWDLVGTDAKRLSYPEPLGCLPQDLRPELLDEFATEQGCFFEVDVDERGKPLRVRAFGIASKMPKQSRVLKEVLMGMRYRPARKGTRFVAGTYRSGWISELPGTHPWRRKKPPRE